ncbi:MAG: hypothetical protein WHS86_05195 [Desulfosoma sp.]
MKSRVKKNHFSRFFDDLQDHRVLFKGGSVYLPCPMDPETARELRKAGEGGAFAGVFQRGVHGPKVVFHEGVPYIETIAWEGLVRHAPVLFPQLASGIRKKVCRDLFGKGKARIVLGNTVHLETALFQVLPRFVRLPAWVKSAGNRPQALALWLSKKVGVPERFHRWAVDIRRQDVERGVPKLPGPFGREGCDDAGRRIVGAETLQRDLEASLEMAWREALGKEQENFREKLRPYWDWPAPALGFMLFVLTRGALEVDGFGFFARASDGELVIYKRSGRYALRDYYNRLYLFPDCRVAVTSQDLWPVVVDSYKHPLLPRHQPWQRICLGHSPAGRTFTAAHIIRSLEDGLNALYHGYDPRKRNGYHRLDHFSGFQGDIHFDDLKIPSDDPRCLSGEVPVTNAFS